MDVIADVKIVRGPDRVLFEKLVRASVIKVAALFVPFFEKQILEQKIQRVCLPVLCIGSRQDAA